MPGRGAGQISSPLLSVRDIHQFWRYLMKRFVFLALPAAALLAACADYDTGSDDREPARSTGSYDDYSLNLTEIADQDTHLSL